MKSRFLDPRGRNNNHKKKKTNESITICNKEMNTELNMEFPTLETSVGKKANEPIGVTRVPVTEYVRSVNDNGGDQVGNESCMNRFPSSYANKLSPKSLTKANLQKLKANVPNVADYDVWLPLALVHEVND
ncbi:hypothetical protein Tco_0060865 [Tanacetum coccineum]